MTLPTRRAALALAALAPLGLLGYASPAALDAMLVADAVVALLVLLDARLAADPARIRVEREAPAAGSRGRALVVGYRWRNPARLPARLVVREARPAILGPAPAARRLAVKPGGEVRESFTVTPARRGAEAAGWLAVRSVGPLGLGQRQTRLDLPWSVTVFPSLPQTRLKASVALAVRRREAGLSAQRQLGEGRVFESLREWVRGDDVRIIDWKATARRRKLIARQFEAERRQHVLLLLDAGRLLTAEIAGAPRFEYAVDAAVSLALAAAHHDDDVGVLVFADTVRQYVAPQRGRRGLGQVLEVLARAEATMVEPDYAGAFRFLAVHNRRRALAVLFTDVVDRTASEALVANTATLRPRHLPVAVALQDPELERAAAARPGDVGEAYRKAAAEELLRAREEALAVMRRSGVVVLDVPPARAGAAVVDRYLELKRRGRL